MRKKLFLVVALVIIIGGIFYFSPRTGLEDGIGCVAEAAGSRPLCILKDYNDDIISFSDFDNKAMVINSWATWCPFCVDELPDFAEVQKMFPDDVVFIAIDRRESPQKAKSFTDKLGISNDIVFLLDPNDSFYGVIGGFSMPETLFIRPDGTILEHKRGPLTAEEIKTKVESMLHD